ncbi:MAG: hypothetical protein AAF604_19700 [Acidobacteriota bacterium]
MVRNRWFAVGTVVLAVLVTAPLFAFRQPDESPARQKSYRHADLYIGNLLFPAESLPVGAVATAQQSLASLGLPASKARMDIRSGRWGTLLPSDPILPGRGNSLTWQSLRTAAPASQEDYESVAWDAFYGYLSARQNALGLDLDELQNPGRVAVHGDGKIVQINVPREYHGIRVRDSFLTAVINNGNLVLFGAQKWGDLGISTIPALTAEEARDKVGRYLSPLIADATWRKPHLEIIPMAVGTEMSRIAVGQGYTYRLVWVISPKFSTDLANWESLVDAQTGELLSFEDMTAYASTRAVEGGVFPISNDGLAPDGVEVTYSLPFVDVTNNGVTRFTDTGGNIQSCIDGTISSRLQGRYIQMNDNCGAISESTTGDVLDFGGNPPPSIDCQVAAGRSPGNTHSSRSGYYELTRLNEMARSHTPGDSWLNTPLTATMNINSNCNASGGAGGVNFFTSGGGCSNTGELAGVFDHEWGHGRDATDLAPGFSSPSEGIADIYASLRLNTSCIGRNFRLGNPCNGYGDPCNTCDGVRDIDWANRNSGVPHGIAFIDAACGSGGGTPCGGSTHCEGAVYAEAVWDLWNRDLQSNYGMSLDTAREIASRLTFLGASPVGNWYNCVDGAGTGDGCNADGGYLNYLAIDDDNGDLTDGTPHMQAIFDAYDRHDIACPTPAVQDAGCSGAPTVAPVVSSSTSDRAATLTWGAVAGASSYRIFRTEGVHGCDFGKTIVGDTTDLSFTDTGLRNGEEYFYVVAAMGATGETCMSPVSACTNVTPTGSANLVVDESTAGVQIFTGDGDIFLDNCEDARIAFELQNIGTGSLTNVRIDSVTSPSHPAIDASITFPAVSAATLADGCGIAIGQFDFRPTGLAHNDTVEFTIEVTSDELSPATKTHTVLVPFTESDFSAPSNNLFDFETDFENWSVFEGTFNRTSANGGGNGTAFGVASSGGIDNACDRARSPLVSLNNGSTLSLWNNFTIENVSGGTWYDRANVAIVETNGDRTAVEPDGGRAYNTTNQANYNGCNPSNGWAGTANTWAASTWTAAALQSSTFAGDAVQIEVTYGTDGGLALAGFNFDQVLVTNSSLQIPDAQSDVCGVSGLIFVDGFESGNTSAWTATVQ